MEGYETGPTGLNREEQLGGLWGAGVWKKV
jgi:hypothetical protein